MFDVRLVTTKWGYHGLQNAKYTQKSPKYVTNMAVYVLLLLEQSSGRRRLNDSCQSQAAKHSHDPIVTSRDHARADGLLDRLSNVQQRLVRFVGPKSMSHRHPAIATSKIPPRGEFTERARSDARRLPGRETGKVLWAWLNLPSD